MRGLSYCSVAMERPSVTSVSSVMSRMEIAARQLEAGVGESAVGKALRLWGPDTRPVLETARRLGGVKAGKLFETALETDLALKSGRSGNATRTLEGLAVVLADTCGAQTSGRRN